MGRSKQCEVIGYSLLGKNRFGEVERFSGPTFSSRILNNEYYTLEKIPLDLTLILNIRNVWLYFSDKSVFQRLLGNFNLVLRL